MFVIRRSSHNPIIAPRRERPWEAIATFNPSIVRTSEGTRLYYRALGDPDVLQTPMPGLSTIGMAFAEDGIHFHSRQQVIVPEAPWDHFGCEDPRVTFFEGRWYCFYTALGGYPFGADNIKVGLAVGNEPDRFTERHLITPFNAKAATLFPERVRGEIVMLLTAHTDYTPDHPRPTIAFAHAKRMEDFLDPTYWDNWHAHLDDHSIPDLRRNDRDHIEVGAAPILTEKGWLLLYSYIQNYYDGNARIFSVEAAMLDRDDPRRLIARTESILVPQEFYEEYGIVPNIVFPTSASVTDERLDIWYGASDTVCAKASTRLADLLRALDPDRPARTFARAPQNPILTPRGTGFESRDVFNPAVIELDGTIHILYRAMDAANTSTIGLATTKDGTAITERFSDPIYVPRADFEQKLGNPSGNSGCEDPRIVRIGDMLYMTYTAYDGVHPPAGAVSSIRVTDFLARNWNAWSMPVLLTPDKVDDKDLALLPEMIDGNFLLYHRINSRICADLIPDLDSPRRVSRCIEIMGPRGGMWDGAKVGSAVPPIKVAVAHSAPLHAGVSDTAWLMIYHGVSRHSTYRLGAALLDASGTSVLARTADPIFEPLEPYEREGEIPNVVFSCGAAVRDDTLFLYYGGADKVIGVATASVSRIVDALTS